MRLSSMVLPARKHGEKYFLRSGLHWGFRACAILLAVAQTIVARNGLNPDGRANLELARSILRHDWSMTVNGLWQPLYPWLLAATLAITKPSLRWEFPVAHLLNLVLFLACITAFEFFWGTLLKRTPHSDFEVGRLSPIVLWTLGYSLFIWLSVGYTLTYVKPDEAVLALVLLQAALYLRLKTDSQAGNMVAIYFGVTLGLGYLTKAILFPTAFIFLGMLLLSSKNRRSFIQAAIAAAVFFALSAPEITALSLSKGRLTYADTGRLNIAWHNYGLPYRDWQGEGSSGTPIHATRKINDRPALYEFNGPIRASYPPWFDPSYWNEGLSPKFDVTVVAKHAARNSVDLWRLLVQPKAWIVALLLLLLGASASPTFRAIIDRWDLVLISAAVFAMYCLTTVEARYFPPWQLLVWGAVLAGIRMRPSFRDSMGYRWLSFAIAAVLILSLANGIRGQFLHSRHDDVSLDYQTAEGLRQMGVNAGAKVAAIGFDNDAYFAYLDGLFIVAEINTDDTCEFWQVVPPAQSAIFEKLKKAGVQLIVANTGGAVRNTSHASPIDVAACARPGKGWQQIKGSLNQVYFLN